VLLLMERQAGRAEHGAAHTACFRVELAQLSLAVRTLLAGGF